MLPWSPAEKVPWSLAERVPRFFCGRLGVTLELIEE
jgi:hypothetical protein